MSLIILRNSSLVVISAIRLGAVQGVLDTQGRRKIDNWGGGHIHIFVFTDCKNN